MSNFDDSFLIIPNYDGEPLLRRMLPSVDCPRDRILLVDLESSDGSAAFASKSGCQVLSIPRPSSYCRALNVGVKWAIERNARYIALSNNDVTFTTPVIGPLLRCLHQERRLGVVAPTQIVAERTPPHNLARVIKYRSSWDLERLQFMHDVTCPENQPLLLEADFCEFTTVVIPAAVFSEVGLLDEEFGFFYEDADFCFRAGLKGWRCAYLQTAQIIHYQGSTISAVKGFDKKNYISVNSEFFFKKHSVPGVNFAPLDEDDASELSSWPIASHSLFSALRKYGLIEKDGSRMVYNHPGDDDSEILFPLWETDQLPKEWVPLLSHYRHVLVASEFNRRTFAKHHPSVHKIGLGAEPDQMSPWGDAFRISENKIFLSVFRDQYRKGFDVLLKAWIDAGLWRGSCELVAYSPNLDYRKYINHPGVLLRNANFVSAYDQECKVRYLSPNRDIGISEMSKIYRSADYFVLNSRGEGFGLPVVEAMACGIPSIIPAYSATEEFVTPGGCLKIEGKPVLANYSDKGFGDVGHWWEPDAASLCNAFERAASLSDGERKAMGEIGRQHVLSNFTWRHSAVRFHHFCRNHLHSRQSSAPPITSFRYATRFWQRQASRAALLSQLLRQKQFGRALVRVGRFLQKRGY